MERTSETSPLVRQEAKHLRERLAPREGAPEEEPVRGEHERAVLREYAQTPPPDIVPETARMPAEEAEQITLNLAPEPHDEQVNELLGVMQEKGIHAALAVAEKAGDAHLEDDFHRVLVQYIKEGLPVHGLKERDRLWQVFRTTLYEILLPEAAADAAAKRPLKELLSAMEQFYDGMRAVADAESGRRAHFTLELAVPAGGTSIILYAAVPDAKRDLFEQQIHSLFPKAELREQKNDYNIFVSGGAHAGAVGTLARRGAYPLRTYEAFDHDPLNVIINALSKVAPEEGAAIQLACNPNTAYGERYRRAAEQIEQGTPPRDALKHTDEFAGEVREVGRGVGREAKEIGKAFVQAFVGSSEAERSAGGEERPADQRALEQIRAKTDSFIYAANLRVAASAETAARAEAIVGDIQAAFNQFENTNGNRIDFIPPGRGAFDGFVKSFAFRRFEPARAMPLSVRELTSLLHAPVAEISAPQFRQVRAGAAPAPADLPRDGVLLGTNEYRGARAEARLTAEDRLRHLYVIGQTGTGKTTLLKNIIAQDMAAGEGVCMIDPHGPDVEEVLGMVPEERMNDVIYFDPSDTESVLGLNMLEYDPARPEQKTFVVNELFAIFQKLYGAVPESMGPMFEQYFRNATLLALEGADGGSTLLDISRIFADEEYRARSLARTDNPVVRQFWERIAGEAGGDQSLANIAPYVTSKIDVFTANDYLRPIIAQERSAIDFRRVMDERKILLVNLAKGRLGEINANLLGLIIVGKILMAALGRTGGQAAFSPFYFFIDEFQNVTTDSIETILSEARKYKLALTVAHQFIAQLEDGIRDSVFGNVGSLAAFRVGSDDAEFLERQFAPVFSARDLMNIENRNAYLKLLANGQPMKPFDIAIEPPPASDSARAQHIKRLSMQARGRPRADVEAKIREKYRGIL